ncbi:MAG: glycerol-3-phosphate dehydrogenase/oxidase [Anaerolineales bacterium]|nr:glycerol-3-phosphate dehydrogenase/oxidase [Anaerolineales bacterium]
MVNIMWSKGWRQTIWDNINQAWDLLIVGGGITGAGIMREGVRAGLQVLLVDAGDFSTGTSSHSSKLVHGGFRYLRNGQIQLVLQSVRERERLLRDCKGLINPLDFVITCYKGDRIPTPLIGFGLAFYDLLAGKWEHHSLSDHDLNIVCPTVSKRNLVGAFKYTDASTDDSRLVLRLIRESVHHGGTALNYSQVEDLLINRKGQVCGIALRDRAPEGNGQSKEIHAHVVINATGAWADNLRVKTGKKPALRKLRGSHLVFPQHKFPLKCAVSLFHPSDGRPVFVIPWEGITFIGTTDVDHDSDNLYDLKISQVEANYLLAAVKHSFPDLGLELKDVQSTFAGIRGVLYTGKEQSWKEPRKHLLWLDKGMVTITSGKLTTFRQMAHDTLNMIRHQFPHKPSFDTIQPILNPVTVTEQITARIQTNDLLRLIGRYGNEAIDLIENASNEELDSIEGSPSTWAELRWSAQHEGIVHLDDLLLRRIRLGIQLPGGGISILDRIRQTVQTELGWDDEKWLQEAKRYINKWQQHYSPPVAGTKLK